MQKTNYKKGRKILISILISLIKIVFLLGFLIFIHELGHFAVAKLCKVKVNEFAIGFGPTIWRKQGKQTKYALRLIPLGGFISMEGEDEHSEEEGSFTKASIPKRMAIVVAGATVNILFAIIVYFILASTQGNFISTKIESMVPEYAAVNSGLQVNDEIVAVDGKNIHLRTDIDEILQKSEGKTLQITVKRNGENVTIPVTPTAKEYKSTGIYLQGGDSETTKILMVDKGSTSEAHGIQANDKIIEINDNVVTNQEQIIEKINQTQGDNLKLKIQRGNEEIIIELPLDKVNAYYLGVQFQQADNSFGNSIYYGFWNTIDFLSSIVQNVANMFTGNVSINQMMGPVGISEVVAKTNGIKEFVYMLALISISLGITNLLPIPALDGGKLLLLIIEAIRGKRLSEKMEMNIQLLGFAFLITLSLIVTYQDILRLM